ncbi:MAG TPA: hypothetical protein VFZ53_31265 [Polyangiaceae bacterium]
MRAAVACAALGVTSLLCVPSNAEPAPNAELSFVWSAPADCPTREVVLARTERLLGRDIRASLTVSVAIDARVAWLGGESWELRVVSGGAGAAPRRIAARSCDEIADAAALVTALSIDPTLPIAPPSSIGVFESDAAPTIPPASETAAEPRPAPPPPDRPRDEPPPVPRDAPGTTTQPAILLGASFALWTARLPAAAPGASVEAGVALGRIGLTGELGFFPEQHAEGPDGTGGDLWMATGGARASYRLNERGPALLPFAGLSLSWLHGVGTNVENEASGDAGVVSVEPGLRVAYPLWHLSLFGEGLLSIALNRPRFVLDGIGEVYAPSRFAGRFGVGLAWRAP